MPVRVVITEGTRADCQKAERLIDGFEAEALIADKGYDAQEVLDAAKARRMEVVIPPKKNRKDQRDYDRFCISCGIWLKMGSCNSKHGEALQHGMLKTQPPTLQPCRFDALFGGLAYRDDTV
jgi:transposase